jgi:4-amino-4-deoxy-L-arabinose transferase-like glycosyltransferase
MPADAEFHRSNARNDAVGNEGANPSRWASGPAIVAYIALADFLLHLYTAGHYGYFRDELYYLICGRHLAWGYVDQPPLIALIARVSVGLFGSSLRAIRLLPAVAGAATILLAGQVARELGGRRFAQALAALAVFAAPGLLGIDNLLTMNAFEPLFWTGCAWVLARMIRTGDTRLWLLYGLLAGIGLENKSSMVFFGFATVVALLLVPERRLMASRWFWLGGAVAFVIFLPNFLWQMAHGFPTLVLLRNVAASGRNVSLSALGFIAQQIFLMNPVGLVVWLGGLAWCFSRDGKRYRALGWIYLVILACMLALNGRVYYLFPAYPMLFGAGGVALERWPAGRRQASWLRPAYVAALVLVGALLAPILLPVLPVKTYIRYSEALHLAPPRLEMHKRGPLPQIYADMFGWHEMATAVARLYNEIPPGTRAGTVILCANYGEASAIDLFGHKRGLPQAISPHQNFYVWGPGKALMVSVIAVGYSRQELQRYFTWVEQAAVLDNPYAMPYENGPIFYCRGPNVPFSRVWAKMKEWD